MYTTFMGQSADVKLHQQLPINNSEVCTSISIHVASFKVRQSPGKQPQQLPSEKTHLLSHNPFFTGKQEKMLQRGKVTCKSGHCSRIPRALSLNHIRTGFTCKYFSDRKTNTSMHRGRRELSLSFRHHG